jgi:septum formation protein
LLRSAGYTFTVVVPPYIEPEHMGPGVPPIQQAEALSYFKARSVISQIGAGLILAADTLVALRGAVYGKPMDLQDARRILTALSGTTHEVITGITLLDPATRRRLIRHDVTRVTMRPLRPEALESYLNSGASEGKAGAYGIQDRDDPFVLRTEGSFSNVVGLPLELLARMLKEWQADSGIPDSGVGGQGSTSAVQSRPGAPE